MPGPADVRYTPLDLSGFCCDIMHSETIPRRHPLDFNQYWGTVVMAHKGNERGYGLSG